MSTVRASFVFCSFFSALLWPFLPELSATRFLGQHFNVLSSLIYCRDLFFVPVLATVVFLLHQSLGTINVQFLLHFGLRFRVLHLINALMQIAIGFKKASFGNIETSKARAVLRFCASKAASSCPTINACRSRFCIRAGG